MLQIISAQYTAEVAIYSLSRNPTHVCSGPQALNAGKDKLQAKVQGHLRKARNSLLLTRPRTSTTAANKATMADQKPLPTFVAPSSLPASAASTLPTPFVFGSLPYVGGKKVNKEDDMDIEE